MEPIQLPPKIVERAARVLDYHAQSKHSYQSVRATPHRLDPAERPSPFRLFDHAPAIALPEDLLPLTTDTLDVLRYGPDSLPEGLMHPPHDLRTLATWLYMAAGLTGDRVSGDATVHLRSCPSAGALFPCEIYVVACDIDGLESGLYHFASSNFELRRLRGGPETLSRIVRGRPDLSFMKTCPGALLVSTLFARSAWKYQLRAYRYCVMDCGHLVQNLLMTAAGLGVPAMTRLRVSDSAMTELIGVAADAPFFDAERVQAMIVWADKTARPLKHVGAGPKLPPIERRPICPAGVDYPAIVATHRDCVAPGVAVAEVRPPLTELTVHTAELPRIPVAAADPEEALPLGQVLLSRRSQRHYLPDAVTYQQFIEINWLAFRAGAYWPLRPEGNHTALVRPFWVVHAVSGMDSGIWYYDPVGDAWSLLRAGDFRASCA